MCVEAAVCYAMGMPHGDNPVCVGAAVRTFKIALNDKEWSSPRARAKGMRRVAIAQLGSDKIDQSAFTKEIAFQTTKQIVPIALRAAAKLNPAHADNLEAAAIGCEVAMDYLSAKNAAYAAADAADAAYAANAAADSAYATDEKKKTKDGIFSKAAEIAVQALIKLGCEGTQWLDLTE